MAIVADYAMTIGCSNKALAIHLWQVQCSKCRKNIIIKTKLGFVYILYIELAISFLMLGHGSVLNIINCTGDQPGLHLEVCIIGGNNLFLSIQC